jgi:hypothetical protein
VSVLARHHGDIDGNWKARAPGVNISLQGNTPITVQLPLTTGTLSVGVYDLVIFVRQDIGKLSHETEIEMPNAIKVVS